MKFGIDIGHNCAPDTGAIGLKSEDVLNVEVGDRLIRKLRGAGHEAIDCTPSSARSVQDSLRRRIEKANEDKVDVFVLVSLFNALNGKAHGTEIYALSSAAQAIALRVLKQITALGFTDRGVRSTPAFYVLKNTAMPAILVECCFIDSAKDMGLFDAEKMAEAISRGLIGD